MTSFTESQTVSHKLIRQVRSKTITKTDLQMASKFALDTVANILAGVNSDVGANLLTWASAHGYYTGTETRTGDAGRLAFVLGNLCNILEMDDLHRGAVLHPGCVVVPAIFGIHSTCGDQISFTGQKALEALLHGFETIIRVGRAVGTEHYKIWHNTATCGPFGSAMAAAHLLGLDENQTAAALGNAGTQAAGLWEFKKSGAMSKHIHAGRGAEAGTVAAELAAVGFSGAPEIFEGDQGFFRAMCPDGSIERILAGPDEPWQVHLTSFKPWPTCRHTHAAITAASTIRDRIASKGLDAEAIDRIEIRTYQTALSMCDKSKPASIEEAKFSIQHSVACALALPNVDFASLEKKAREKVASLRARITVGPSPVYDKAYPEAWGADLEIYLRSGECLQASTKHAKGDPELPLSREELIDKVRMLLQHAGVKDPQTLIERVLAMADDGPVPALPFSECHRNLNHN
jgi:2-methylcitrate dehydratase PrpD